MDRESFQKLEGFYRIIGNKSKYWEIRGNIVKQYDAHDLFPESNEMSIEYGDLGKQQTPLTTINYIECRSMKLPVLLYSISGEYILVC